jgi:voltage-gated sodium channel
MRGGESAVMAVAQHQVKDNEEVEVEKQKQDAADEQAADRHFQDQVLTQLIRRQPGVSFDDGPLFSGFISCMIFINAVIMGLEADFDLGIAGEAFSHIFTATWAVEMCIRLQSKGPRKYFANAWNRLDFFLANFSLVDVWLLPLISGSESGPGLRMLSILRILRMVRLVRVIRVLRFFHELWLLVNGLINALSLLSWVFLLMFIILYMGALVMRQAVGHECGPGESFGDWANCESMFGTMPRSMYTLFQVITLESWSMAVVRPIYEVKAWLAISFFSAFLYLTTFGLLNIVMGVIVEQTLKSAQENEVKLQKQAEVQQKRELSMLRTIFQNADEDKGGQVSLEEFVHTCEREDVQKTFELLDIVVSRARLARRLFQVLDGESKGVLTIEEILSATQRLKHEGKSSLKDPTLMLMDIRYLARRLDGIESQIVNIQGNMKTLADGKIDVVGNCAEPLKECQLTAKGESERAHDRLDALDARLQRMEDRQEQQTRLLSEILKELRQQPALPASAGFGPPQRNTAGVPLANNPQGRESWPPVWNACFPQPASGLPGLPERPIRATDEGKEVTRT